MFFLFLGVRRRACGGAWDCQFIDVVVWGNVGNGRWKLAGCAGGLLLCGLARRHRLGSWGDWEM
jgi:hypothetical protein